MSIVINPPYFRCQNISSAQISSVNNSNCILWRVEMYALVFYSYFIEFESARCIFQVFATLLFDAIFNSHWVDTFDDSSKDVDVPFTTTRLRFSKCLSSLSESYTKLHFCKHRLKDQGLWHNHFLLYREKINKKFWYSDIAHQNCITLFLDLILSMNHKTLSWK